MMEWNRMVWMRHVARLKERERSHRILMGKYEGKRPLGRRRRRWESIKIQVEIIEIGWDGAEILLSSQEGLC
jgi:hypothetical protein